MFLFEISSEVCRKIGGIYTVISTKAPYIKAKLKENYFLVGIYDHISEKEIHHEKPPRWLENILNSLNEEGITAYYGKWNTVDNVQVILISLDRIKSLHIKTIGKDGNTINQKMSDFYKFRLWEEFGIDSLHDNSWNLEESILFGIGCGKLIEQLEPAIKKFDEDIICHFHEWISGPGLLYLKMNRVKVKTVFTTHATLLGRVMSSHGKDVFSDAQKKQNKINMSIAYQYGIEAKYMIERACAHRADVFTTVSTSVATECEYTLSKKPDCITINGFNTKLLDANQKNQIALYARTRLLKLAESCFAPYYDINLSNCRLIYTSGRYEYTNKGFDIFIEGLATLNNKLKNINWNGTVIGFLFVPSMTTGPIKEVKSNFETINTVYDYLEHVGIKNIYNTFGSVKNAIESIKNEKTKTELMTMYKNMTKKTNNPPVNTHELPYEHDIILKECARFKLNNTINDKVKILFYPTYVNHLDNLLMTDYYLLTYGTDIGIFLSRYEPFGYTPAEAALTNNITITSDFSGFGKLIESKFGYCENINHSIIVMKMVGKEHDQIIKKFSDLLYELTLLDDKKMEQLKQDAEYVYKLLDWSSLIKNYFYAYELALRK